MPFFFFFSFFFPFFTSPSWLTIWSHLDSYRVPALLQLLTAATQRIMSTISPCIGSTLLCHCHLLSSVSAACRHSIPTETCQPGFSSYLSSFPFINRRSGLFHAYIPS
ncbi:hypothetical protein BDW75DRAFT_135832 [Aspergillus navahoensis]